MSNLLKREKGFTLIEIVLVLAIAGLLLVIVFLAVSGAQKNRRDTQRKTDLSRIGAQIESFASNNNGCYPGLPAATPGCTAGTVAFAAAAACGGGTNFCNTTYITGMNLNDPLSGLAYTYITDPTATPAAPTATAAATVSYYVGITGGTGTTCDGVVNTSTRVYTVRMGLEQGYGCRDNK